MIRKIFRRLKLTLNPIKAGDVFIGDCQDFGMSRLLEQVCHRLCDIEGRITHTHWFGPNTYRLTVISKSMPMYYILKAEVLTRTVDERGQFIWMERSMERRIDKKKFLNMILEGNLTRSQQ